MNAEIRRVFIVLACLFAALVGMGTYWLWRAPDLEARRDNPSLVVRQVTVKRGLIYASDGRTVLASNVRREVQGRTWFLRRYPRGGLAAHAVGYSTLGRSRAGLEESQNDFLTGSNGDFSTALDRLKDKVAGDVQQGNHLVTTLDATAQREALDALGTTCGAAVALEPATGRVLVLASTPTYDPNDVESNFAGIEGIRGQCADPAPLLDRATQGLFIPGSTFKLVTAAAAIDSGRYDEGSTFLDRGYCIRYGKRVTNYADQDGPEVFGRVTLAESMEHSINAVFCDIGTELGPQLLLDYARRFGFYERPPLDLPAQERVASGLYDDGRLYEPRVASDVDVGRLAFGQERLLATPLQMAMVTAGIANGGLVMKPHLVARILEPDGSILTTTKPEALGQAISPDTAAQLSRMMELVVESGTGTTAQIAGVRVAGKTGTAETGRDGRNDTWFVAFAPAESPRIAVAVALSDQAGTGGATAAPIARRIIESLLRSSA